MTLDEAIDAFEANPCEDTALGVRRQADDYLRDEMIEVSTHQGLYDRTRDFCVDAMEG